MATLLLGISVAHVSLNFVYGVPARFGVGVVQAAAVIGLLYVVQASAIIAAARGTGYLVNAAIGAGWSIAAVLDHLGEILSAEPYRQGLPRRVWRSHSSSPAQRCSCSQCARHGCARP